MKLVVKHCSAWGGIVTHTICVDSNDDVDNLQEIIARKFNIPKNKQILKFKRDGITFKLTRGWGLAHFGLEDKSQISLDILHPDNQVKGAEKKYRGIQMKGEYYSKLGLFERKQENEEEEDYENDYEERLVRHSNISRHSLAYTSESPYTNDCFLDDETNSRGSGSLSAQKVCRKKVIKEKALALIKETKAGNQKALAEVLNDSIDMEESLEDHKEMKTLEAKDIINEKGDQGWNAFHWSVYHGDEKMCNQYIEAGADINIKTCDGWTALQLATYKNNYEVVKLLLNTGRINVNEVTCKGTALHIAAKNGKVCIVSFLIAHGADCSIKIENEGTACEVTNNDKIKEMVENARLKAYAETQEEGTPFKIPIVKGWMYSRTEYFLQMCPRYFVLNPEEGTFARYKKKEDFPNRPREIIPLKEIEVVLRKRPGTFANKSLHYIELQYQKKYIMACNTEEAANQWLYYIMQGSVYSTYLDEKFKKELSLSGEKSAFMKSCIAINLQKEVELVDEKQEIAKCETLSCSRTRAETIHSLSELPPAMIGGCIKSFSEANESYDKTEEEVVNLDSFEIIKEVGSGSFGKVFMVQKKDTKKIYALKAIKTCQLNDENQLQYALTESEILKKTHHAYIVNLHYAFQTEEYYYLVMDYCSGGDMACYFSRRERLSEEEARFYIAELVQAIEYLHSLNIIYRDLKPENILLDADGHIKLADFGLAKEGICDNDVAKSFCGSPAYLPPEILMNAGVSKAGDVYGIGAILFEMLTGKPPYYSEQIPILYNNIKRAALQFPRGISAEAKDLIQKLLERNPSQRLGARDKNEIKNHAFFKNVNWKMVTDKMMVPPRGKGLCRNNQATPVIY